MVSGALKALKHIELREVKFQQQALNTLQAINNTR
jgi:hypothetical protein